MLLFKQAHVPLILEGRKTQTRRLWIKPRVKAGTLQKCYCGMPFSGGHHFATIRVLRVWPQLLHKMSQDEVWAEGYNTMADFVSAFAKINRIPVSYATPEAVRATPCQVWAVEFELVKG